MSCIVSAGLSELAVAASIDADVENRDVVSSTGRSQSYHRVSVRYQYDSISPVHVSFMEAIVQYVVSLSRICRTQADGSVCIARIDSRVMQSCNGFHALTPYEIFLRRT